ncbi:DUF4248 domain-containing protein [Bacteroides mediterraneensis]
MNGIDWKRMHGGPDGDLPFHCRVYRKSELAQLYFPESDTKTALQGLARWIKRCAELGEALEAVGYEKNRRFFRKPEVELIVKFLGEP